MGTSNGFAQDMSYKEFSRSFLNIDDRNNAQMGNIVALGERTGNDAFSSNSENAKVMRENSIDLLGNPLNKAHSDQKVLPVRKPWKAMKFVRDVNIYNPNTTMDWLWDGKPDAHPRIFHTARGSTLPHTFSFDLGRIYKNLVQFEEWGRQGVKFSNPIHFEVWGIDDFNKGVPDMPADDPDWAKASVKKGWTLLAEVFRTDDGIGSVKVDLVDNPPPVRYIRIRVKETIDRNKDGLSHMSELSFWYVE